MTANIPKSRNGERAVDAAGNIYAERLRYLGKDLNAPTAPRVRLTAEEQLERGIDPATGAPRDFEALIQNYHGMVLAMADKLGIHPSDREDAAAEVELRFWKNGAFDWYDPTLQHEAPAAGWRDGLKAKTRTARFSTFYRRFVFLHMMQERDRHNGRRRRETLVDMGPVDTHPQRDVTEADFVDALCSEMAYDDVVARVREALSIPIGIIAPGREDLLATFEALLEASYAPKAVPRTVLAAGLDISSRKAQANIRRIVEVMADLGITVDSLREAS